MRMSFQLEKAIYHARLLAKDTGYIHIVSVPERAYYKYLVSSLLDHYATEEERRPKVLKVVFPETTINVQE